MFLCTTWLLFHWKGENVIAWMQVDYNEIITGGLVWGGSGKLFPVRFVYVEQLLVLYS